MVDLHALIHRMADELDRYRRILHDDRSPYHPLAAEARAALAEPEPEWLTDEELLGLMPEAMRDGFLYAAKVCSDATGGQVKPRIFRVCLNTAALEYARAVLARWGDGPAVPKRREPASVTAKPSDQLEAHGQA